MLKRDALVERVATSRASDSSRSGRPLFLRYCYHGRWEKMASAGPSPAPSQDIEGTNQGLAHLRYSTQEYSTGIRSRFDHHSRIVLTQVQPNDVALDTSALNSKVGCGSGKERLQLQCKISLLLPRRATQRRQTALLYLRPAKPG